MSSELSLSDIYESFIQRLEKFVAKKNWRIKLLVILTFSSLFLSTGAYFYLPTAMNGENWQSFNEKKEHIFSQPNFNEVSHAAKKTFRLTVPLIAKIFHLGNYIVFLLQFVVTILFLFFSIKLGEKITGDAVTGLLTAAGLVFIYAGHAGFTDINTWFDEFAYFFLLMAMVSEKPYLIFIWLQLACWTDERALFSSAIIFIWWKLRELRSNAFNLASFFKIGWNSSVVVLSLLTYFITRYTITSLYHIHTPSGGVGLGVLMNDTDFIGMGLWTAMEGFWILIIAALVVLWKQKKFFLGASLLLWISIIMVVALCVFDITRSGQYVFPVIFISLLILKETFSPDQIRKILLVSALVCFLFPAYYIITDVKPYILWYKPFVVRLIDYYRIHHYGY